MARLAAPLNSAVPTADTAWVDAHATGSDATWKEGRVSRGWRLTQVAWALIRADRTMLVLAVAGIVSSLVLLAIVFLLVVAASDSSSGQFGLAFAVALYPSTLASVFFNVALAGAASAAFDGERLSAREALRIAWGKRRRIAGWALISVLVGMLIDQIASRVPGGGRIVAWFAGAAWGLATMFVVPILALEGVGPVEALGRSSRLVKRRWGEGITGRVAIGAWSVIAVVPLAFALAIGGALLRQHPETGVVLIALSVVGLFAVIAAVAATQQVFTVALYRYAIDAPIGGFAASDLEYPFVADRAKQKRKSWILRIGVPILALFAILALIGAIVGPHHRQTGAEGSGQTAAEGYLHYDFAASSAPALRPGAPVVLQRRQIGAVVGSEPFGSYVRVVVRVDPRLRGYVEMLPASVGHYHGRAYLRVSQPPSATSGSPRS